MTTVPHTLERWRLQWQQRSLRERRFIAVLALLFAAAVSWSGIWQPMTKHLQQMQRELPLAREQLKQAQRQLGESAGWSRRTATPASANAETAIDRAIARFNVKVAARDVKQNTASITFSEISFDTLVQMLEALQREEHFYVTTATLTPLSAIANEQAGRPLRAELVLTRPSS